MMFDCPIFLGPLAGGSCLVVCYALPPLVAEIAQRLLTVYGAV